jgi:hypothetical protein
MPRKIVWAAPFMMKQQRSIETLYALIFAVCILAALLLLTGWG